MQFLAQIALSDTGIAALAKREQFVLLFECANDPGMCDEWEPDAGGNAALVVPVANAIPLLPPGWSRRKAERERHEALFLKEVQAIKLIDYDDSIQQEYDDDAYAEVVQTDTTVIGKLGGRPVWIQADETPTCSCGRKMTFLAQFQPQAGVGLNFGDFGCGYAFICGRCKSKAKFLWQC